METARHPGLLVRPTRQARSRSGGLGTCFPVPWGLAGRLHQGTGPGWRWGPHSRCRGAQWNSGTPPGSRGSGQVRGVWVPVGITCGVTPGDSCDQFSQWEGASSPCPQLPFPICSARACLRHAGLRGASSEATDAPGAGRTGSFRRWAVSTASGLGIRQAQRLGRSQVKGECEKRDRQTVNGRAGGKMKCRKTIKK